MSYRFIGCAVVALVASLQWGCDGEATLVEANGFPPTRTEEPPAPGGGTGGGAEVSGPAQLTLEVEASPTQASVGQMIFLHVRVRNIGGGRALTVSPATPLQKGVGLATLLDPPDPSTLAIAAGEGHIFTYVYEATDSGPLSFEVSVDGMDEATEAALAAGPAVANLQIHGAPLLTTDAITAPATSLVGQPFTVKMTISNGGQSAAQKVTPSALSTTGTATVELVSGPTPATADIAGGANAVFEWSYRAKTAGTVTFSGSAGGEDVHSGRTVSSNPASSSVIDIDSPAALTASIVVPSQAATGAPFTATMIVKNTGSAVARGVTASALIAVPGTGNVTLQVAGTQAAVDIPGGGSAPFSWTVTPSGTGTASLSGSASGVDAMSNAAINTGVQVSSAVAVVAPPSLEVVSLTAPSSVTRGQSFQVALTVKNTGGSALENVLPSPLPLAATSAGGAQASSSTAIAPQLLAAGATATFTWTFVESGSSGGSLTFASSAVGVDPIFKSQVTAASSASAVVNVLQPASLTATLVAPANVTLDTNFNVTLTVTNNGQSAASAVIPSVTFTGSAAATQVAAPAMQNIAAGASAAFTFSYKATTSGTLVFTGGAAGRDANSNQAVSAPQISSSPVTVSSPSALVATLSIPARVAAGSAFTATLTVRNTGTVLARAVRPAPLSPTVTTLSGTASAATTSSNPAAVDLPGGGTATFSWTFSASGAGSLSLSVGASGTDSATNATVTAATATSPAADVVAPAALTVESITAPSSISEGQTFTVSMKVKNAGGTIASGVLPNPVLPVVTATGAANATATSTPTAQDLAPGGTATFSWTFLDQSAGTGTLTFTTGARGTDAVFGSAITAPNASSQLVRVQTPPAISVEVNGPQTATVGTAFNFTVVVRNDGQAEARLVKPTALVVSGTAAGVLQSGPTPASANIPAGGAASFVYSYLPSAAGSLSASAGATFSDANSGQASSVPAVSSSTVSVLTPPALSVTLSIPSSVSSGQQFNAVMVVRNTGGTAATAVAPSPLIPTVSTVSGNASATAGFTPAPVDIPGGGSATFTWPFTASGSGALSVTSGATGKDGNGAALNAAAMTSNQAQVVLPATLTVTSVSVPTTIVRGQSFTVTMTVTNGGGAALNNVVPVPNPLTVTPSGAARATTVSTAGAQNLAAGATASFTWTFTENGTGLGSLVFSAGARGTDAVSNAPVTAATVSSNAVAVANPAQLVVSALTVPARISRGQTFNAVVTVRNNGGVAANNVKPTAVTPTRTGGAAATTSTVPTGVSIAAGAEASFSYAFLENGTAPGSIVFAAGATGADSVSGTALTAPSVSSSAMTVQSAAALSVTSISLPATITRGTAFSVSMTVTNTGEATANAVLPSPSPLTRNATGGALASTTTAQTAVSIAGGASQTFTWQYMENGTAAGTLSFTGSAVGTDGNSGAALTGAARTSAVAQVVAPSNLRITSITLPATLVRGQTFTLSMTVQNMGGTAVNGVLPSPNPLTALAQGGAAASTTTSQTARNIAAGASTTFSWTYTENGTAAGSLSFTGGAAGTEAGTSTQVRATAVQSNVANVVAPARLAIDSVVVPAKVSRGQPFNVAVTVRNTGGSTANSVRPTLSVTPSGTAAASTSTAPAAVSIAAGATQTFTYAYTENGTGAGTLTFNATASGTDSSTSTAISAAAVSSSAVTVQTRAALSATLVAPGNVARGASFSISMTVTNGGQGNAVSVMPTAPVVAVTGGAAATTTTAQTAVTLAGGQSHSFTWLYRESGTSQGSLTFSASASGRDENSVATISSPTATSTAVQVVTPARLTVTSLTAPATVARGQSFTVTMTVQNSGGSTANAVTPNPAIPTALAQGGAAASSTSSVTAQNIAGGASATFSWTFTENGTGTGSLTFSAGASGSDSVTGGMISAAAISSAAVNVVSSANLVVDAVTLPARISRGQSFTTSIVVRNTGGVTAKTVSLSPSPPTVVATGDAALSTASAPLAQDIAPGASATYTFPYRESGTGAGTLQLRVQAVGTDAVRNVAVSSALVQSSVLTVETPASLSISSFVIPVNLNRGATFAVSMTVFNTGQATATNVLPMPQPLTTTVSGGVAVTTTTTVSAVSIPGNSSQTFTWTYTENGGGAGTLSFTGSARGVDGNSGLAQTTAAATSNVSTVGSAVVCATSNAYAGLGGRSLDGSRVDLPAQSDRLRPKPYSVLVPEMTRVLNTTPSSINNRGATFDEAEPMWWIEPELNALSMYQLLRSSFQGCLSYTGSATQYSANPTSTTATTNCQAFQRRFWSREPTPAELNACVTFAVSADNNDTNPRRRWAYVCSAVMTSVGFIAD